MSNGVWIYGRNAVHEVLRAGRRDVRRIKVASGIEVNQTLMGIIEQAQKADIPVERLPRAELDRVTQDHQGVMAQVSEYEYVSLDEIIAHATNTREAPFLLLLDVIQDPQNLGTLLRTAEAFGVHGVVIPSRRSATVTPAVVSASSGASEHLMIAQHNLAQAIRTLKEQGVWVTGLDVSPGAQQIHEVDLSGPVALVVGNEGRGMRRLVQENCDYLVRVPMRGAIDSLNAAVAGSIVLFHVWERRNFIGFEA